MLGAFVITLREGLQKAGILPPVVEHVWDMHRPVETAGSPGPERGARVAQIAAVIRTLAVALWIGGIAALDLIDAPARFASPLLTRNQAVGIGQILFVRFNRFALALAVIALVASIPAETPGWSVALLGLMLILVGVQAAYLTPAITRLSEGLDFVHRAAGDPRYAAIRPLHTTYTVLEAIIFLSGVIALAAWVRPGRR